MPGILVIDDDPMTLRYTRDLLEFAGHEVRTASSAAEALRELRSNASPNAILLDIMMPETDGIKTLGEILRLVPAANVIVVSGKEDSARVVQAIKLGAVDYLTHPLDEERLLSALQRVTPAAEQEDPQVLLEEFDSESFFLAASPVMKKIYEQVERIARVDVPVLITGESGTGKEVIATLLHKHSPRSKNRFLKVNCAAIPEDLLESELFGYEAGAFTGASTSKPGYFEQCNHGTILLDEIGEMSPRLQAKLLQVLQEQRFFRLGGKCPVEVDVRILAATNIDVKAAIEQGKLRLDIYYRLNAFGISLPPLRERREEIAPLFKQFMRRLAQSYRHAPKPLTESMRQTFSQYTWPGNLRELHNVVKRYLVLGDDKLTGGAAGGTTKSFSLRRQSESSVGTLKHVVREMKREAETEAIRNALEQTQGRRKEAAELLGICYKALIYKSRQYGILGPSSRGKRKLPTAAGAEELLDINMLEGPVANLGGSRLSALKDSLRKTAAIGAE